MIKQIKEKQLHDFEAQLAATQAENESERGRLNALIHRLENTLVQQGSEVSKLITYMLKKKYYFRKIFTYLYPECM